VRARPATPGELVETYTSDGKETQKRAEEDDVVVWNTTEAGEKYIISGKKFRARYTLIGPAEGSPGWSWYKAIGRVKAIRFRYEMLDGMPVDLGKIKVFSFEASWGEQMVLKDGDMIATPLPQMNEIYRIAAKEFAETYEEEKGVS
jgi:hypothetical protein